MSTVATPPVPAPITVNSSVADIAAANAASQSTATPGQPTPVPSPSPAPTAPALPYSQTDLGDGKVRVEYPTGEKFEGTWAEIGPKMAEAHINTKRWAQEKVQQVQQPAPQTPAAPQSPFTDPQEAAVAEYTANLLAKTLGYENAIQMRADLGVISHNSMDYGSQTVAIKFQAAQPDFNATPENSEKLLKTISEAGMDDAFNNASADQQVRMMQQAHAFCLMTKTYDPRPTTQQPGVPTPPPPAPVGREQIVQGVLPPELVATVNDSPDVIRQKWDKARAMGYRV